MKSILKSVARPALSLVRSAPKALYWYRYHQRSVKEAKRIRNNIEGVKGSLPQLVVKQCNDYAKDVLGHRRFAAWLYVYSAIAGCFKEGWIPDNYWRSVVVPKLTDSIKDKLFADQDRVVFKLDNSLKGTGIFFFDRESFAPSKMDKLGNGIFQKFIKQHEVFQELAKESVATLRMTTVSEDDGTTSVRGSYLRLGTGADTHVQSKSHIRIPIDIKSGAFHSVGFTPDWLEVD